MRRSLARFLPLLSLPFVAAQLFTACSPGDGNTPTTASASSGTGGAPRTGGSGGTGGMAPDPSAVCTELTLPVRPFAAGPYGTHRGEVADDFTIDLLDGSSWH